MIGLAVALSVAAAQPEPSDLSDRLNESAVAAQALQGPLDGAWTLSDASGRSLYLLQITDPPGSSHILTAAWRQSRPPGQTGIVDRIVRRGDRMKLQWALEGPSGLSIRLERRSPTKWEGLATLGRREIPVILRRAH